MQEVDSVLQKEVCFSCGKPAENSGCQSATFEVDEQVKAYALLLEATELLTKLNSAYTVALKANYHTRYLVSLYKYAQKTKAEGYRDADEKEAVSGIAFVELVRYIKHTCQLDEET